jgi:hypothetical protein
MDHKREEAPMSYHNRDRRQRAARRERRDAYATNQLRTLVDDPNSGEIHFSAGKWGDAAKALCQRHGIPYEVKVDSKDYAAGDVVVPTSQLSPEQREILSKGAYEIMSH